MIYLKSNDLVELIAKEPIIEHDLFSKWEELNPDLTISAFNMQLHRLRKINLIVKNPDGKYKVNDIMLKEQIKRLRNFTYNYQLPEEVVSFISKALFLEIAFNYFPKEKQDKAKEITKKQVDFLKKKPEKKPIEVIINKKSEVITNE